MFIITEPGSQDRCITGTLWPSRPSRLVKLKLWSSERTYLKKTKNGTTPGVGLHMCVLAHSHMCLLAFATQEQEVEAVKSLQIQEQVELRNEFQPALAV